jgi:hypothetical protein
MDTASMIDALQALGPHPDIAEDLMLFGQFVGAWDVDVTNITLDGTRKELKREWHFGWVLEGRATWIGPVRHLVLPFIARKSKDEIILEGSFTPGCRTRWVFSHITPTSFHWRNLESNDDGTTWRSVQEMVAQRVSKGDTEMLAI